MVLKLPKLPKLPFLQTTPSPLASRTALLNQLQEQINVYINPDQFKELPPSERIDIATAEGQRLAGVAKQYHTLQEDVPQPLLNFAAVLQKEIAKAQRELGIETTPGPFTPTTSTSQLPAILQPRSQLPSPGSDKEKTPSPHKSKSPVETESLEYKQLLGPLRNLYTTSTGSTASQPPPPPPPQGPQQGPAPVMAAPRPHLHDIKFPILPLFTGKREQLKRWKTTITLYLGAHDIATLPNDFQVLFALSHISDDSNAGVWKENWLASVNAAQNRAQNPQNGYGTLQQLFMDIMAAFTTTTLVQEALRKLKSLKMGATSADEHMANYELLVDKAELAMAGDAILIDFYRSSLAPWLIERIYQSDVPNMLQEWKEHAILLDHNKRLATAFTGGGHSGGHAVGEKVFSPGFRRIYCWSGYSSCRLRVQLYVYLFHKSTQRV